VTNRRAVVAALAVTALAGCGDPSAPAALRHNLDITAGPMAGVTRITAAVQPANVEADLAYDDARGQFVGALVVPAGHQIVTLSARGDLDGDGVAEVVGTGSAQVDVTADRIASLFVQIVALAPPPPVPDHAPMITSFHVSSASPAIHELVAVDVSAEDPDGDEVTFAWDVSCPHDLVLDTPWSGTLALAQAGACTLTVTATANGQSDVAVAQLTVQDGAGGPQGSLAVDATFVTRPYVASVQVTGAGYSCGIDRLGTNATCPGDVTLAAVYDVSVTASSLPAGAVVDLADECGGTTALASAGETTVFRWTAPAASGVCMLSASVTWSGASDVFPIAVFAR
jgi:hypothetical protein